MSTMVAGVSAKCAVQIRDAVGRADHDAVLDLALTHLGGLYLAGLRREMAEWLLSVPGSVVMASPQRVVEYTGALLFLARAEWVGWLPAATQAAANDRLLRSRVTGFQAIRAGSAADLDGFERKLNEGRAMRGADESDPYDELIDAWYARMLSLTQRHSEAVWRATNLYLRPKTLVSDVAALSVLAGVYAAAGLDPSQHVASAIEEWRRLGEPDVVGMTDALIVAADLALERGDHAEAERMAEAAIRVSYDRPIHLPGVRAEIAMARVEAAGPEPDAAERSSARLQRVHAMLDMLPGATLAVGELVRTVANVAAPPELQEPLTVRELLVLGQLASDRKLDEIAAELYISPNTAKTYVSRLYRKLGVHDRSAAVAAGERLGILLGDQRSA